MVTQQEMTGTKNPNRSNLYHFGFLILLYPLLSALFLIEGGALERAFLYYIFFGLTLCYMVAAKQGEIPSSMSRIDYYSSFLFANVMFGLWLAITEILSGDLIKSKFVGLVCIWSMGALAFLIVALTHYNKEDEGILSCTLSLRLCYTVLMLTLGVMSAYLFFSGEWVWNIEELGTIVGNALDNWYVNRPQS